MFCFMFEGHEEECLNSADEYRATRRVEAGSIVVEVDWFGFTARGLRPDCCVSDPDVPVNMMLSIRYPEGTETPYSGTNIYLDYAYDSDLRPFRCVRRRNQELCQKDRFVSLTEVDSQTVQLEVVEPAVLKGAAEASHSLVERDSGSCPYPRCDFIRSGKISARFHLNF